MWKSTCPIALSAGLAGCTLGRAAWPELSVRAMTVLHDRAAVRADDPRGRRVDFALSVQLALNPGARSRQQRELETERDPHFSAEPVTCTDQTLCSWADAAEQSVLAAMGVLP
jgi:hypothetical protein